MAKGRKKTMRMRTRTGRRRRRRKGRRRRKAEEEEESEEVSEEEGGEEDGAEDDEGGGEVTWDAALRGTARAWGRASSSTKAWHPV